MTPNQPVSGLNWSFVLIGAADATLLPFIPLYLFQHGLGAPQIGAVLAAAAAASLAAGMGWAYLSDRRIRPESAVVAGTAAAGAVVLLLPLANGALALAALTGALLVARSPFLLLDPIALQRLREASRTRYARIRLRMSAGWAVTAVASGGVYQVIGLRLMPFLYAPFVGLFGLWVWRSLRPTASQHIHSDPLATGTRRLPRLPPAMIGFLFSCLLLGASFAAAQNFVVLRINVLGGGALLIGAAAAFQAITEIPTMGTTHLLTRRLSHKFLFAIGCGIYLAVFLVWAFTSDALVMALMRLVTGVAFALTYISAVLITDDLSPARLRATGQALVKSVMFGLAPIAGSLGGGLIYGSLGPRVMFLAATVVVAAAGVIAIFAVRNPESRSLVEHPEARLAEASSRAG